MWSQKEDSWHYICPLASNISVRFYGPFFKCLLTIFQRVSSNQVNNLVVWFPLKTRSIPHISHINLGFHTFTKAWITRRKSLIAVCTLISSNFAQQQTSCQKHYFLLKKTQVCSADLGTTHGEEIWTMPRGQLPTACLSQHRMLAVNFLLAQREGKGRAPMHHQVWTLRKAHQVVMCKLLSG